ncbi:hypothetical protein [Scytonema sp. NUACC26]|uniref:hypothetical protein n=1 Tax=Scytonema sp. NUACC26 TaxID=3140176 RepID=UPI0038B2F20F
MQSDESFVWSDFLRRHPRGTGEINVVENGLSDTPLGVKLRLSQILLYELASPAKVT